jgi:hypothetical protein
MRLEMFNFSDRKNFTVTVEYFENKAIDKCFRQKLYDPKDDK